MINKLLAVCSTIHAEPPDDRQNRRQAGEVNMNFPAQTCAINKLL
jgi:hypothetical protein